MDPIVQLILSTGTLVVAAAIAIVIGSRKGLADVEARSDTAMARLVEALEKRIEVLEKDLAGANQHIARLQDEVDQLQRRLEIEKAATERLRARR